MPYPRRISAYIEHELFLNSARKALDVDFKIDFETRQSMRKFIGRFNSWRRAHAADSDDNPPHIRLLHSALIAVSVCPRIEKGYGQDKCHALFTTHLPRHFPEIVRARATFDAALRGENIEIMPISETHTLPDAFDTAVSLARSATEANPFDMLRNKDGKKGAEND